MKFSFDKFLDGFIPAFGLISLLVLFVASIKTPLIFLVLIIIVGIPAAVGAFVALRLGGGE